jgi:hypothetical protein
LKTLCFVSTKAVDTIFARAWWELPQ